MNINWQLKSTAFRLIDVFSLHRLLFFLQKHVTRNSQSQTSEIPWDWLAHQANLARLDNPRVLEFGAGKTLSQNIFLSQYFRSQTVVDLFPMLDIDLVNRSALNLSKLCSSIRYKPITTILDIERNYGIRYIAPLDVCNAPFPDNTFDACISTNTLEHIPQGEIIRIFVELKRVLRQGGLVSAVIDYVDHYSYTDRNISRLNYLQYSADDFKRFNHNVHHQNRLRHYDYARVFDGLGYEILRSEATDFASPPIHISNDFDRDNPLLCAGKGIFLLQVNK